MDVDTRLLRYFAAVADEGNLTRAAQRLFVSQPALTKQIKQLESQLGMPLFTRSRAGMTLTPAGQALAKSTPAVLAEWDQALRETKAAASRAVRVLRVGFMSSAANEATQQIIAAFGRRRPGCGSTCSRPPGQIPPPGSPAAMSTPPCCGCRSPARTPYGSRCCSRSPAGSC
jgi:DNA-binding transcriptional LysR family regulator